MNSPSLQNQPTPIWAPNYRPLGPEQLARILAETCWDTPVPSNAPNWDPKWNWPAPQSQPLLLQQFAQSLPVKGCSVPTPPSPLFDLDDPARIIGLPQIIGYLEDGTPITMQTPLEQCRSGTEIRVWVTDHVIPIWHYGILVKTGGKLTVIHCTRGEGVIETSVAAFASGGRIEVTRSPSSDPHQQRILATARENLKRRVQWAWGSNCEDFTNFCYTLQKGSVQRNRFYLAFGVALFVGLAAANREQ